MLRISTGPDKESIHHLVVVVFDRNSGRVHGTYVHGSHGAHDEAGAQRGGERLRSEVTKRLGASADLDVLHVPLESLQGGSIARVDPTTRDVVVDNRRTR
jgi:hypothetical protein